MTDRARKRLIARSVLRESFFLALELAAGAAQHSDLRVVGIALAWRECCGALGVS